MFAETYRNDNIHLTESFGVPYPEVFYTVEYENHPHTHTPVLIDLCHWGALRLTGADRVRLLNALVTNDVDSLEPGSGCHSALTTIKGKLVAELFVLRRENELFVLVSQGDTAVVSATIEKHIIADDVTLEDVSGDYGVLAVEGPIARGIVWRLFPATPLPESPLQFTDADYLGRTVTLVNNSATGEPGYHLVAPAAGIRRIRKHLLQSGLADDAIAAGRAAWDMRRVEAGLPWWDTDVVAGENFPKECRCESLVNYEKGCYLGQETLARMHHRGHPNRLLVGLETDAPEPPRAGSELYAPGDADKPIGHVTSAVDSPALQKPLMMGYVRREAAEPGNSLVLRVDGSETTVTVVSLPVK
jgi:folate-binding protein YgfZ